MGQGSAKAIARLAADLLGVDADQVEVPPPDTDRVPYDTRTTSSRSTHMMGRALEAAVEDLKNSGGDYGHGRIANEGGLDVDTGQGIASSHWHQGAAAAAVEVDDETGLLTLRSVHAVLLRRPGRQPGRGRAPAGGLDDHGHRDHPVRGAHLRRGPGRRAEPLRLQHPVRPGLRRRQPDAPGGRGRRGPRAGRDGAATGPAGDRERAGQRSATDPPSCH